MYVFTSPRLGWAEAVADDVSLAVARNRHYGRALGWSAQSTRIARLLGAGAAPLGERALVDAVARWQRAHGLRADGVIGPQTWSRMRAAMNGAAPTSAAGPGGVTSAGAPQLVRSEPAPPLVTLYVSIPLGSEAPARALTGIFVPDGYRREPQVDVVLYLPGHKLGMRGVSNDVAIDAYWNRRRFPYWPLREGVNESGKNLILVAPTLGPKSEGYGLTRAGGLDAYLAKVMSALAAYGPYRNGPPPTLGNLILACHSGGGARMRQLAMSSQASAARIRECWGFDCLYGSSDPEAWEGWARRNPSARLFVYYLGSTAKLSTTLAAKRLPNVFVEQSRARDHFWVPITHWKERLQNAPLRPK